MALKIQQIILLNINILLDFFCHSFIWTFFFQHDVDSLLCSGRFHDALSSLPILSFERGNYISSICPAVCSGPFPYDMYTRIYAYIILFIFSVAGYSRKSKWPHYMAALLGSNWEIVRLFVFLFRFTQIVIIGFIFGELGALHRVQGILYRSSDKPTKVAWFRSPHTLNGPIIIIIITCAFMNAHIIYHILPEEGPVCCHLENISNYYKFLKRAFITSRQPVCMYANIWEHIHLGGCVCFQWQNVWAEFQTESAIISHSRSKNIAEYRRTLNNFHVWLSYISRRLFPLCLAGADLSQKEKDFNDKFMGMEDQQFAFPIFSTHTHTS